MYINFKIKKQNYLNIKAIPKNEGVLLNFRILEKRILEKIELDDRV